jgi:hypothetical protein
MIIDIHEKFDVSPEWFEEQMKREDGWIERLCQLLAVYKVQDEAGAAEAAERMKAVVGDIEAIRVAME